MGATQSAPETPRDVANTFIDTQLHGAQTVIFSRTDCGFCDAAKRVLRTEALRAQRGGCASAAAPRVVELDEALDARAARDVVDALAERTGAATVPRVFVAGECIGGAEETARAARVGALGAALRFAAGCAPRD